jgi:hypothetical protein
LSLDGHLAVSFRNIARAVPLNGIRDAALDIRLNGVMNELARLELRFQIVLLRLLRRLGSPREDGRSPSAIRP